MEKGIHPDKALEFITAFAKACTLHTESVPIAEAVGRIVPYPIVSLVDQPPFTKSAMDGYAYCRAYQAEFYKVAQPVRAGFSSKKPLEPGEVIPIMTGAPIPDGADAVQRIEWTERTHDGVRFTKPESITNLIERGENCKAGDVVLTPRKISPQDIGILAASGIGFIHASISPKVTIISTGDELYEPLQVIDKNLDRESLTHVIQETSRRLGPAGIFDSNGYQLSAHARAVGASVKFLGIVKDFREELIKTLTDALQNSDVVIVSGGVSMGDFDFIPSVAQSLGVQGIFHNLAMRPGKPTFFGTKGEKAFFGLPGNPVSTFVNFEIFIKPFLYQLQGIQYNPPILACQLAEDIRRKGSDRVEYLPAHIDFPNTVIRPLPYHGSSMITALGNANALIRMELGEDHLSKGATIHARLIRPLD